MTFKKCSSCKKDRDVDEFPFNIMGKHHRGSKCHLCIRKYEKARRKKAKAKKKHNIKFI